MTLLEKLNQELSKEGLEFKMAKEYNDKFKGTLVDIIENFGISFEVWKCLQTNEIKSHAKWCRNYMNNSLKLNELMKGGK